MPWRPPAVKLVTRLLEWVCLTGIVEENKSVGCHFNGLKPSNILATMSDRSLVWRVESDSRPKTVTRPAEIRTGSFAALPSYMVWLADEPPDSYDISDAPVLPEPS